MDTETAWALERVNDRIELLETSVRGDIAQLRDDVTNQGRSLRTEIAEQGSSLRAEMAEQGSSLRAELRDGLAEARRHAVMLNESTRDDIRLVAEAVAVMAVKVDSLQK